MPEAVKLCIGGVGDGQRHWPRNERGMLLAAPEFNLRTPPGNDPVVTSRYRRCALSLGDYSIDVWIDVGKLLVKGYRRPKHG